MLIIMMYEKNPINFRAAKIDQTDGQACPRAIVSAGMGHRHSIVCPVVIRLTQQKAPDPCFSLSRTRQVAQHGEYRPQAAGEFLICSILCRVE